MKKFNKRLSLWLVGILAVTSVVWYVEQPQIVYAAIAVANSSTGGTEASGGVASIAATAKNMTTGNTVVVGCRFFAGTSSTVTDTAGNTYTAAGATLTNGNSIRMFYSANITGNAANVVQCNFSVNGTFTSISVVEYSGLSSTPLDVNNTATGNSNAPTSGTWTTAQADEVIVGFTTYNGGVTLTAGNIGGTASNERTAVVANTKMEDLIVSSVQTSKTAAFAASGSSTWPMTTLSFKAASSTAAQVTRITVTNGRLAIPQWNGYSFERTITVANASSTQSSFPVLVCFNGASPCNATVTSLATIANGGNVRSSTGLDIIFTSDQTGFNILPYEQEFYASTTGESEYWVNVSSVTNGTVFYMFYGKDNAVDRSNTTGTWNTNFAGVWHLPNGTTLTANNSITGVAGTLSGSPVAIAGQIDGGGSFGGHSGDKITTDYSTHGTTRSYEIWAKTAGAGGGNRGRFWEKRVAGAQVEILYYNTADAGQPFVEFDRNWTAGGTAGVVAWGTATNSLTLSTWVHIVVTYDSTSATNDPIIYFNGVSQALTQSTPDGSSAAATNTDAYLMGNRGNDDARNFNGSLDEFHIVNVILTSSWVASEYNNQSAPSTFYTLGGETLNYGGRLILPGF